MISFLLLAHAALRPFPAPTTVEARLASIPLDAMPIAGEVTIHWNDQQVPFIEAETDDDVPVALGVVHAHLRLGQIEFLRRIVRGRTAEMGGRLFAPIDRSIRTLEIDRAVPAIEAMLPAATRKWLEAFVAGINAYAARVEKLPFEFRVLDLAREPWTVGDVLAIGRLIAIDVNWLDWFPMLKQRRNKDWPELWSRLVASGDTSLPSFRAGPRGTLLRRLLSHFTRSGSNSFVVGGRRTATGASLIASDPHVGLMVPGLWLLAGYKSPGLHAIGLMFPGLPILALGRNPEIAWGGTNMHAASSDLFATGGRPATETTVRKERIRIRGWFDRTYDVRDTALGPIISDLGMLNAGAGPDFALKWVGHDASDEITPLLAMSRAGNWSEFHAAFKGYAVSGMNILYADRRGNIGQVLAIKLPIRKNNRPRDLILDGADPAEMWQGYLETHDLPHSYNPNEGFLVSANNRPVEHEVPIGYFFSTNDRIQRISALLSLQEQVGLDDLRRIQADVMMPSGLDLRDVIVERLTELGLDISDDPRRREAVLLLRSWNGSYRAASRGALAFELMVHDLSKQYYGPTFGVIKTATYANVGRIKPLLEEDMAKTPPDALRSHLVHALGRTARGLSRYENWGAMHRYGLSHIFGALPVLGRRYRFVDHPAPGSSDTVLKTAHGSTDQRHRVGYGASARHISDLSDLDRNWFAVLGGQDGWLNSASFLDQVPAWLEGAYIQMPMRLETVRTTFRHRTVLKRSLTAQDDST